MTRTLLLTLVWIMVPTIASADIVTDWNATMRNVLQQNGTHPAQKANPGWSTRSMAMVNGAIYDAFQSVNRTHTPFMFNSHAQPDTSLDAAVHQAAYELLLECYPHEQSMLDVDYNARMATIPGGQAKTNGMNLGHAIAQAYMANRANDHANETFPYTPGVGPGKWRPDPFHPDQVAWGQAWGAVDPFAIPSTDEFIDALPPIPAMDSQAYTDAFNMVKEYGAVDSAARTAEQTEIGLFWAYDRPAMGPPAALFTRFLESIAEGAGNTPEENARLYAMTSVATADAATAAWDAKFSANFWRPVAGIQEADTDGNPDTIADPDWRPLGAPGPDPNDMTDDFTPPFPSYTSGHSTMGGALFKTLELFYGTNVYDEIDGIIGNDPFYTVTSEEPGSGGSRDFSTFTQDGLLGVGLENSPEGENGMSRIYLGVHWIFDQQDGIDMGHDIAGYVAANHFLAVPEPGSLMLALVSLIGAAGLVRWRRCSR